MKQDSNSDKKLPEGIRLLPNGKYMVSVSRHYVRRSRQALSLKEALTVKSELLKELEMGIEASPPRKAQAHRRVPDGGKGASWTLEVALDRTITTCWQDGQGGRDNAIRNAKECVRFFGPRTRLDTIDPDWIDEYVDYLSKKGNSGSTINRKLSSLSRMLTTAYERGKLKWLPKMPRRPCGQDGMFSSILCGLEALTSRGELEGLAVHPEDTPEAYRSLPIDLLSLDSGRNLPT